MRPQLFLDSIGDMVALKEQALQIVDSLDGEVLLDSQLLVISKQHGLNLSTMVLYQWMLNHEQHGAFIEQVNNADCTVSTTADLPELFIVPGLFYKHIPALGSDARLLCEIAERFGIKTTVVPTRSLGGVAENQEILRDFLQSNSHKPYWLASISRGSAEIKWLLHEDKDADLFEHLRGWVSVNGVISGCRIFDRAGTNALWRLFYRGLARINGVNPDAVDDAQMNCAQWTETCLPENTSYINVVALPMSWDVSSPVQSRYKKLSRFGPNDGAMILSDYLREPGLFYPVLGADHLMRDSQLSRVFYKLINRLLIDQTTLPTMRS